MEFTLTFIKLFVVTIGLAMPLLLAMALLVIVMAVIVGRREGWGVFDSIYWAFITATTVGFGDIHPESRLSRCLAVAIAFVGLIFTGIMVSIAVASTTHAFEKHMDMDRVQKVLEAID